MFLVGLSPINGTTLWANQIGGAGADKGNGVLHSGGRVLLAGRMGDAGYMGGFQYREVENLNMVITYPPSYNVTKNTSVTGNGTSGALSKVFSNNETVVPDAIYSNIWNISNVSGLQAVARINVTFTVTGAYKARARLGI